MAAAIVTPLIKKERLDPMAYLGFQKGGPHVRWPLVLTQGGAKPSFPIFLLCKKKKFLAKGGPWPIWPKGKYATDWILLFLRTIDQSATYHLYQSWWSGLSHNNWTASSATLGAYHPINGRRLFFFAAPAIWNSLPEHISQFHFFYYFNKQLKTQFSPP